MKSVFVSSRGKNEIGLFTLLQGGALRRSDEARRPTQYSTAHAVFNG
jgi:hypothetical protein